MSFCDIFLSTTLARKIDPVRTPMVLFLHDSTSTIGRFWTYINTFIGQPKNPSSQSHPRMFLYSNKIAGQGIKTYSCLFLSKLSILKMLIYDWFSHVSPPNANILIITIILSSYSYFYKQICQATLEAVSSIEVRFFYWIYVVYVVFWLDFLIIAIRFQFRYPPLIDCLESIVTIVMPSVQ